MTWFDSLFIIAEAGVLWYLSWFGWKKRYHLDPDYKLTWWVQTICAFIVTCAIPFIWRYS